MFRKALRVFLALALLGGTLPVHAESGISDPDVAKGIRLVDEGDYDGAIVTLDGAVRRLAADPSHPGDLPQAYLYLGIAFVGKGHEAAAKAKFREALRRIKDLSLSADKFPPKVIDAFEAAREEMAREGSASSTGAASPKPGPATATTTGKKGGGGKGLLILGGIVVAGGGVALAAGGGGGSKSTTGGGGGLTTTVFPNEVVVFGGGRDFVVDVKGSGRLTAKVVWQQDGVLLSTYIVNLANPLTVLTDGSQTASKEVSLQLDVTQGSYRISVTNSSGNGPQVDTTFTLTVVHP